MDRRTARTRAAIRQAFLKLIRERRFEEIGVGDIIEAAGIGKSTFYDHYRSKDEMLVGLMGAMLHELAAAGAGQSQPAQLRGLLEHFWEGRRLGRVVFAGQMGQVIARRIAALIEERAGAKEPSARLASVGRAHELVAILHAWTTGEISAGVDDVLAALLRRAV